MFEEEVPKPKKQALLEKPLLDALSIADLRDYVAALQDEIARVESKVAEKSAAKGAAESVFGKRS